VAHAERSLVRDIIEWLAAQWISRFGEITLTMGDLRLKMHVDHVDEPPKLELLWWEQPFSCAPKHPVWVGAPEETWAEVGKLILAAAGVESAPPSEVQSTYLEIVRQSMGSLAQDIGDRISTQVSAGNGSESPPGIVERYTLQIETVLPEKTGRFYLVIANELCRFLGSHVIAIEPPSNALVPKAPLDAATGQLRGGESRTFDLLLDVELPVSVSFGRASLKLQDAMKLITGSLIELDRSVADPVDLLVNNCVIARGEVVVVDGNYGVRIIEIISQKERLQQTRRYILQ
jgi:flagellar motor switch protein FliN/FliY